MPTIRVLLFGPLGEQQGASEVVLEINPDSTPLDVVHRLGMDRWLEAGLRCAIDSKFCELSEPLGAADELALLPPVSGG